MPAEHLLKKLSPSTDNLAEWEVVEPEVVGSEYNAELGSEANEFIHRAVNEGPSNTENHDIITNVAFEPEKEHPGVKSKEEELKIEGTNHDTAEQPDPPYTAFSQRQVILIFIIVIFVGFLGPLSGNIYIPALPILQDVFGLSATAINATVSVFMAVFAVGPLIWASFADFGGRKILYMISLLMTVVVNILLASVPVNVGALFALRVIQAFASSSVMALGAGTVSDIRPPRVRGKAIAYFMLGPNMGPILAPIIAGLILMHGSYWRWLFGFTCILSGIGLIIVVALLPETLRCIVGNGDSKWRGRETKDKIGPMKTFSIAGLLVFSDIGILKPASESSEFQKLYPRPPKPSLAVYWGLLKFLPVTICSITTAILFAAYYAFSVTFSHFLRENYNLTNLQIGACYVCPGVALLLGSIIGGHLSDYFRKLWIKRHDGERFPSEKRLVLQIWGLLLNICGCVGYGWSVQFHHHLAVVLVFSFFTAFGMTWCSNTSMTYLTECVPRRAAGTVAVGSFFRNLAAGISSVIVMKLCDKMGVGWCFTGLAFCDLASMAGVLYLITNGHRWKPEL
ncbi:LAQU0S12e03774g1_1 [Lachancea quebecensis]|uniref:LAQU0S12e03774g1_1 n=1 Tax=Lachancea quebecensis TaxID=1654605 RepID=A0A0P1KUM4_9SACH|nr:LAQU0S12e03774g1_1 [Lachancea quebecensis]